MLRIGGIIYRIQNQCYWIPPLMKSIPCVLTISVINIAHCFPVKIWGTLIWAGTVNAGPVMNEWVHECRLDSWRVSSLSLIGSDNNPTELPTSHFWTFSISLSTSGLRGLCSVGLYKTGGRLSNEFHLHVEFSPLVSDSWRQPTRKSNNVWFFYFLGRVSRIRIKRSTMYCI